MEAQNELSKRNKKRRKNRKNRHSANTSSRRKGKNKQDFRKISSKNNSILNNQFGQLETARGVISNTSTPASKKAAEFVGYKNVIKDSFLSQKGFQKVGAKQPIFIIESQSAQNKNNSYTSTNCSITELGYKVVECQDARFKALMKARKLSSPNSFYGGSKALNERRSATGGHTTYASSFGRRQAGGVRSKTPGLPVKKAP